MFCETVMNATTFLVRTSDRALLAFVKLTLDEPEHQAGLPHRRLS